MNQLWIGPLLLAVLCLGWLGVQRAWLACMQQPADRDALDRPGYCGGACACRGECPRRRNNSTVGLTDEETVT
ncbi:MAG: hypothetical protein ACNA8J_09820 [Gammaproteobacteria bacterium]